VTIGRVVPGKREGAFLGLSIAVAAFGGFWIGYAVREWQHEMKPKDFGRVQMAMRILLVGGLIGLAIMG
jgi:hypothetical protein